MLGQLGQDCLEEDPARRPPTAAAIASRLEEFRVALDESARPDVVGLAIAQVTQQEAEARALAESRRATAEQERAEAPQAA